MNDFERTRRFRSHILEHLCSDEIDRALDELCSDKQISRYQAARQRLKQDRMVVAVIGRQGIGKSTLGNALALSGYITGDEAKQPLAFSLLVNGTASRKVRQHMDKVVELLARWAREMPLRDEVALK